MLWTEDYHIHTKRCKHATGEPEAYVEQAIRLGLKEIAFTDHIPLPNGFDRAHRMDLNELDAYVNDVLNLQKRYSEIRIRLGIEADFIDGFESFLQKTLTDYPFEIIILSVHFLAHWPKGQWVFKYDFPDKTIKEIYSEYLQAVKRGIETGLFNVVGHLDLIKRPGASLLKHNEAEVREVLMAAKAKNMAVEINTSGLRKAIGETYPHLSFLPLIAEYGLAVTLGSDAHAPHQVGFEFEKVAKEIGKVKGLRRAMF